MTTLRLAAERAMKSLEDAIKVWKEEMEFRSCVSVADSWSESAAALRVALADQSEQALGMVNPVAWLGFNPRTGAPELANAMPAPSVMRDFKMRPLVYGDTSISPQRKPLTNEELDALAIDEDGLPNSHFEFARAIERAHGIEGEK